MWLVLATALILLGGVLLGYVTWFTRQATGAFACCRVELLDEKSKTVTTADVTLVGTPRVYRLIRITHDGALDRDPLPTPEGFELEQDHELGPHTVSWIPSTKCRVAPNRAVRFAFPFDPQSSASTRVTGWIETKIGAGGSGTFFHVPVGPLGRSERELINLESRVRAEAVTRGIRPADHPEWGEVLRRRGSESGQA